MEMNLINNLGNNLESIIAAEQKNFLESNLGQALDSALDFGLKAILPDLIEEDVIDVKNAFVQEGFQEGVNTAINKAVTLGKNIAGIFSGNFENLTDIKNAIKRGGLIDNFSKLLDGILNIVEDKTAINKGVVNVIRTGKEAILNVASNNVEKSFKDQANSLTKIEKYIEQWNKSYDKQDFNSMEREYKKIEKELQKIIPIENVLTKAREVENLHMLIKNNGKNFNISEYAKELASQLA